MDIRKVIVSPEAAIIIKQLKDENGELLFHQSGGCCDGSAPMCYPQNEFRIGDNDVLLGEIEGCPFYMSGFQYDYWKHTQLIIDITKGRGSSFSLEIPLGLRFVVKSRLFTEEELIALGFLEL
ncbi:MAG: DUF779 domain-containing protein [Thermonemataceae bacterium]|nr:DUF779 domain-containing protein [Thermonemataceae bacterium]